MGRYRSFKASDPPVRFPAGCRPCGPHPPSYTRAQLKFTSSGGERSFEIGHFGQAQNEAIDRSLEPGQRVPKGSKNAVHLHPVGTAIEARDFLLPGKGKR